MSQNEQLDRKSVATRVKGAILSMADLVGLRGWLHDAYWGWRLRNKTCTIEIGSVSRRLYSINQRIQSRLLRMSNEREQLEAFLDLATPGDVVWDVGAHMGLYAVFASHFVGEEGRVCAFEPEPHILKRLIANCDLNHLTNVQFIPMALSDQAGTGEIFSSPRARGTASLKKGTGRQARWRIQIETGERLVSSGLVPPPNVVKIDVEGGEFGVLNGMRPQLAGTACRYLLIEVHPKGLRQFGHNVDQVRSVIEDSGYRIEKTFSRGSEFHWLACK